MACLSVCGQVGDIFFLVFLFVCFLFNMGTILSVLLVKRSRNWVLFLLQYI